MTPLNIDAPLLMIVDDDDRFRDRLHQSFHRRGYLVKSFASGADALTAARNQSPEYALVDLRLKGEWGLHVVTSLLEIDPETQVVVLTAYGSIATAIEAVKLGAKSYLQKPVSVEEMEKTLNSKKGLESEPSTSLIDQNSNFPTLAKVEWEYINRVLTECEGNIRQTALRLGMHRRTLQRKLSKFPNKD